MNRNLKFLSNVSVVISLCVPIFWLGFLYCLISQNKESINDINSKVNAYDDRIDNLEKELQVINSYCGIKLNAK